MLQRLYPFAATCLLVGALQPIAFAEVVTVAQAGPADFAQISDAIAWAAEGDTIWIRGGDYDGIEIIGKSLHLIAKEGSRVTVDGLVVANLTEKQLVTIGGLGFWNSRVLPLDQPAMTILNCAGSVRLQDCRFREDVTIPTGSSHRSTVSLAVVNSQDVDLTRCKLRGGWYSDPAMPEGACLTAVDSRLALHDSEIEGFKGGSAYDMSAGDGGVGVYLLDSTLISTRSRIRGGQGGFSNVMPGDGGAGLIAQGTSQAYFLGDFNGFLWFLPEGGGGGYCEGFYCSSGSQGVDYIVGPGASIHRSSSPSRSWQCEGLSFDNRSLSLTVWGEAGDQVYCLRSGGGDFQFEPGGVRLIQSPGLAGPYLGTITDDPFEVDVPILELGGLADEATMLLQVFIVSAKGELHWLAPTALSILDDSRITSFMAPVFVDAAAPDGGDGLSWATSYNDLNVALEAVQESFDVDLAVPRQLWVAGGRYVPLPLSSGSPGITIGFPGGLYGGFAGTEQSLDQRIPGAHPTVIDGDVLGDDGPDFSNYEDNLGRLGFFGASLGQRICVDQITFRGVEGVSYAHAVATYGAVEFTSCTFRDMKMDRGNTLYLQGLPARTLVQDSLFVNNYSASGDAVALYCRGTVDLVNCEFRGNVAPQGEGGAVLTSTYGGHGIRIIDCLFEGNQAESGGALYCWAGLSPDRVTTIVGCTFVNNHASLEAGGLMVKSSGSSQDPDAFKVHNSILWGNSAAGFFDESAQITWAGLSQLSSFIEYSSVEGWTGALGGSGNHGLDPLLDAEGQLSAGSPCLDAGNNSAVLADFSDLDGDGDTAEPTPLDLARQPRFVDDPAVTDSGSGQAPLVDMGAFERQP